MKICIVFACIVGIATAVPLFNDRAVNQNGCGRAKIPVSRIVGGTTAQKGQYPWIVSMKLSTMAGLTHACGGTIIDDQWILTAAHCFINSNNPAAYMIRVGTFNQSAEDTEPEAQNIRVQKLIKHENFSMTTNIRHDIALIKLQSKINFSSDYVNRICLPKSHPFTTDNQLAIAIGWGDTVNTSSKNIPHLLQQTQLTVQTDATCKRLWGTFMWADEQMLCAAGLNTSPCSGDSGGPLMLTASDGAYIQVGVASFVSDTGCSGLLPTVFTRVSNYADWIAKTIAANP